MSKSEFPQMTKLIPATERVPGHPYIEHYTVTEKDSQRSSLGGYWGYTPPGHYCFLKVAATIGHPSWDVLWMSDTPREQSAHRAFLRAAEGDVLLAGLGLGMVAVALCRKAEVRSVTVLEIDREIVGLVAPHLAHRKLRVIQCDAEHPPLRGRHFDAIYLDIWAGICSDNWEEMKPMLTEYRRFRRNGGIVTGWLKDYVQQEHNAGR